jgi:hypothetical protein
MAFAWGFAGDSAPRVTLRGGAGIFYDRIPDNVVLRTQQLDGVRQREYFVSHEAILDLFPALPSESILTGFAVPKSRLQLANDVRTPYTINSSLGIESQILPGITVALTASKLRTLHLLRSRNINAPLPEAAPAHQLAARPLEEPSDVFQYESSGVFDQNQLLLNTIFRFSKVLTFWSTYTLSDSRSDADSPDTFPSNSYDLQAEYSRSALHPRHSVYWGGWIRTRWGIELTPLVVWRSGLPFDITTGRDTNGDALFTDRPAFATDLTRPGVVVTPLGVFDLDPQPGQQIIPRNFGDSEQFVTANLRVAKRFQLNERTSMTFSIQGTNIFNRTNPGSPIGNLGSPLFGAANTSAGDWGLGSNQAGNRRLELMWVFTLD